MYLFVFISIIFILLAWKPALCGGVIYYKLLVSLMAAGKLQELTNEMDRYRWNLLGPCKMRLKKFGETNEEGHGVLFSGKEEKHEHGVG